MVLLIALAAVGFADVISTGVGVEKVFAVVNHSLNYYDIRESSSGSH